VVARLKSAMANLFLVGLIILWWWFLMGVTRDYWWLQWSFTLALAPFVVIYAYRAFTLSVDSDRRPRERPGGHGQPELREP